MDNAAVAQRFKAFLLIGIGLLLAAFLGFSVGNENYFPLLLGAVIISVGAIGLFLGDSFWVLTIASSFLSGTFPILRGQFTPFQILMAMGVARFVIGDVILRRRAIQWGNRIDFMLMAGFMGILLVHGVQDRFGMRFLGSQVWGGRNYVNVFVGLAAFFIVRSLSLKPQVWAKLPYAILAVTGFDVIIGVVTTIFPSSIYKIYPFYSAVSLSGIQEIVGTPAEQGIEPMARLGIFGVFGFVIILLVISSISIPQLLSPANFFRLVAAMVGGVAVLASSFRTSVFQTLIAAVIAGIRDLKWAVLAFIPVVAAGLLFLSVLNSEIVTLPRAVQRSLSFLPGKWDSDMQINAQSSNEYREQIWTVFLHEYFPLHRLFGRGFGFRSESVEESVYKYDPNWDRQAVEVGNIHNGFLATLDALGIVGTIFFVAWNTRLFVRTFQVPIRLRSREGTALRFLGLYLAVSILFYWIGAYTVGTFLPQEFALAGVFLRLQQTIGLKPSNLRERPIAVSSPELAIQR